MTKITIRSRIHQFFTKEIMDGMYKIIKSPVSDNNKKIDLIINLLKNTSINFSEVGSGTNRLAIKIENYVFKIALDRWGMIDNDNEFAMSEELQPHVVKTYESNGLLSVCEYVAAIENKEEFQYNFDKIKKTLSRLAEEGYVMGDVGLIPKNFCNWGFRQNKELVILDFAYIFRITADEIFCSNCSHPLGYDSKFVNLICDKCNRKYSFADIRKLVSIENEKGDQNIAKEHSFKLKTALEVFEVATNIKEEEIDMRNGFDRKDEFYDGDDFSMEELDKAYYDALYENDTSSEPNEMPLAVVGESVVNEQPIITKAIVKNDLGGILFEKEDQTVLGKCYDDPSPVIVIKESIIEDDPIIIQIQNDINESIDKKLQESSDSSDSESITSEIENIKRNIATLSNELELSEFVDSCEDDGVVNLLESDLYNELLRNQNIAEDGIEFEEDGIIIADEESSDENIQNQNLDIIENEANDPDHESKSFMDIIKNNPITEEITEEITKSFSEAIILKVSDIDMGEPNGFRILDENGNIIKGE